MNKKYLFILSILVLFLPKIYSNDSITSKIVFYREASMISAPVPFKVYVNNELVVKLRNNSYFEYYCPPGDYSIYVRENTEKQISLRVEEGKTYYVKMEIAFSIFQKKTELMTVDSVWAYPAIYQTNIRKIDNDNAFLIRTKNRIGLNINCGVALDSYSLFTNTFSEESIIWFGGGYSLGLKYGYEINKYFDMAVDLNCQVSIRTGLDNTHANFTQWNIWITPSVIIPIDGGDAMRLKFGGGINYNWLPTLKINCPDIPGGFVDTWKYKNAFGYHVRMVYEVNYSDRISTMLGFGYSNVQYEISSWETTAPTNLELLKPNGSAIDFLLGFYFYF